MEMDFKGKSVDEMGSWLRDLGFGDRCIQRYTG